MLRDNLNCTAPALATTKGDIFAATGANAVARVGAAADFDGNGTIDLAVGDERPRHWSST